MAMAPRRLPAVARRPIVVVANRRAAPRAAALEYEQVQPAGSPWQQPVRGAEYERPTGDSFNWRQPVGAAFGQRHRAQRPAHHARPGAGRPARRPRHDESEYEYE